MSDLAGSMSRAASRSGHGQQHGCDCRTRTDARRARHLGLDAVRLGGAAFLHRGDHLHLRPLFRLAHGRATRQPARRPGATASRRPASSSRSCRRCSVRSPTRPARASRGSASSRRSRSSASSCSGSPRRAQACSGSSRLFSLASIAAEFSTVFNDSMMPRLVSKAEIGRISNIAWGLGYLGGMIVLIFVVAFMAASPETGKTIIGVDPLFGLDPQAGEDARATGPLSAVWYFIFILPMFFFTPDGKKGMPIGAAVREGLAELRSTHRRGAPSQRHLALPDRAHDLPGRRQRRCWRSAASSPPACSAGRSPRSASSASSSTSSPSSAAWSAAGLDTALGSKHVVMIVAGAC